MKIEEVRKEIEASEKVINRIEGTLEEFRLMITICEFNLKKLYLELLVNLDTLL